MIRNEHEQRATHEHTGVCAWVPPKEVTETNPSFQVASASNERRTRIARKLSSPNVETTLYLSKASEAIQVRKNELCITSEPLERKNASAPIQHVDRGGWGRGDWGMGGPRGTIQ